MKRKTDHEETEKLDAETLTALEEGIKSAENGRRWTLEEAVEFARKRRAEWNQIPNDRTA